MSKSKPKLPIDVSSAKFSEAFIFNTLLTGKHVIENLEEVAPFYAEDCVVAPGKGVVPPLALQPFLGDRKWTLSSIQALSMILNDSLVQRRLNFLLTGINDDFDFVAEGEMEPGVKWQLYHLMTIKSKKARKMLSMPTEKAWINGLIKKGLPWDEVETAEQRYQMVTDFFGKEFIKTFGKLSLFPNAFLKEKGSLAVYFKLFNAIEASFLNRKDQVFLNFLRPFANNDKEFNSWLNGIAFHFSSGFDLRLPSESDAGERCKNQYWFSIDEIRDNGGLFSSTSSLPAPQNDSERLICLERLSSRLQSFDKTDEFFSKVGVVLALKQALLLVDEKPKYKEEVMRILDENRVFEDDFIDRLFVKSDSGSAQFKLDKVMSLVLQVKIQRSLTPTPHALPQNRL